MKKFFKKYAIVLLSLLLFMLVGTANTVKAESEKIDPVSEDDLHWNGGVNIEDYKATFTGVDSDEVKEYKIVAYYSPTSDSEAEDENIKETTVTKGSMHENVGSASLKELYGSLQAGYYWVEVTTIATDGSGKDNSDPVKLGPTLFNELTVKSRTLDKDGQETTGVGGRLGVEHEGVSYVPYDSVTLVLRSDIEYTISAVPNDGYVFKKYEGDLTGSDSPKTISLDVSKTITGVFQENDDETELVFEIGENHTELASKVKDLLVQEGYTATLEGSKVNLTWPLASSLYRPLSLIDEIIQEAINDEAADPTLIDNDEEYEDSIGRQPLKGYADEDEKNDDYFELNNLYVSDVVNQTLYAHWNLPATKLSFTIEKPICGTVAKFSFDSPENQPVITVNADSQVEVVNWGTAPYWCDELNQPIAELIFNGEDTYTAFMTVDGAFGYFIDPNKLQQIKVTNSEGLDLYNTANTLIVKVKAQHEWEFVDFTWKNDNTVFANYKCKYNPQETETVEADVDYSDPKELVATVSAENSLDSQEHSTKEYKIFNLYVGGVHVTGENCDDILGNGTVEYDSENNILTLNNAEIEVSRRNYGFDSDKKEYGIRSNLGSRDNGPGGVAVDKDLLTINLIGSNMIVNDEIDSETTDKYGIYVASQREVRYTGGGSLNIEMDAKGNYVYRGIEMRQPTTYENVDISINMPGSATTRGMMLVYNNLVKLVNANVSINVGNGYGFDSDKDTNKDLDVDKNSIFEAISNNEAVHGSNYFQITDDTKELGVLVNKEASKEGAEVWDGESFDSYKYVRIPSSHTLTIVWTSIDGDELMKTIEVTTEVGNKVSKAVEDVELFEKDGYEALGLFVEKPMSEYSKEIELYENDLSDKTVEKNMILYYPMIKVVDEVELNLDPPVSGDKTTTAKKDDEWDWLNQTNKPKVTSDDERYRVSDQLSNWVEDFDSEPYNPFIGTFESGKTYNGSTIVFPNYGYTIAKDAKYTIENATVVNDFGGLLEFTVVIKDARYLNTEGDGGTWTKGSKDTLDFTFKREVHDELTYSKCEGFMVDGKPLDSKNYETEEGSIIVRLLPSFLETLSVGEHSLTAIFEDGNSVKVKFFVLKKAQPYPIPVTGIE